MAEFEGELNESGESNEDKDELGKATSAFATLLVDIDNIDKTSKTYFMSIASLLVQTALTILIEIANTLIDDLNSISLIH
jgi:hypothetical protein